MDVYVLDKDYNILTCIDYANSTLWDKKYNDLGTSELYLEYTDELFALLKNDYYLYRYDDDMCCRITSVKVTTSVEGGDYLVVTGTDIASMLSFRSINYKQIYTNRNAAELIREFVGYRFTEPAYFEGYVENFVIDDSNFAELTESISGEIGDIDLLTAVLNICKTVKYGLRLSFDLPNKQFVFSLYKGVDRADISHTGYVEFSDVFGNIVTTEYSDNAENYKNMAIVHGKYKYEFFDEASDFYAIYPDNYSIMGLDRRELYVDATSVSQTYKDGDEVEQNYTPEEFNAILESMGRDALANYRRLQTFTGVVDNNSGYAYKTDYNVGDMVVVANRYGISTEARITEVLESDDIDNGYEFEPKFDWIGG